MVNRHRLRDDASDLLGGLEQARSLRTQGRAGSDHGATMVHRPSWPRLSAAFHFHRDDAADVFLRLYKVPVS